MYVCMYSWLTEVGTISLALTGLLLGMKFSYQGMKFSYQGTKFCIQVWSFYLNMKFLPRYEVFVPKCKVFRVDLQFRTHLKTLT
jgi:hypothetical protein